MTQYLLFSFLVRSFASYARLGPSADRRCTGVLRGSAVRPVTQQMNRRTTKNSIKMGMNMQNKPNLRNDQINATPNLTNSYENKSLHRCGRNKPNQTQFKPKTKPFFIPKTAPKAKTNPIQTQFFESLPRAFRRANLPQTYPNATKRNAI